jgi:hypothetical protein
VFFQLSLFHFVLSIDCCDERSAAMSSDSKHAQYELSAVGEPTPRSVVSDDVDMQRMGKKQSFQVYCAPLIPMRTDAHLFNSGISNSSPLPPSRSSRSPAGATSQGQSHQLPTQGARANKDPSTSTQALLNGGTGGIIIIFLVNWFGLSFVVFSLAEMSSM